MISSIVLMYNKQVYSDSKVQTAFLLIVFNRFIPILFLFEIIK